MISSLHNPRVKAAARLRDARGRQQQGRFSIDGVREVRRAAAGGIRLLELFVCRELARSEDFDAAVAAAGRAGAEMIEVSPDVLRKLTFGQRDEGLLAVAETPSRSLVELRLPANPLVAVLAGVEKPGNVGAVLRSADGAGVSALIVADGGTDLFNPNCIRASLGTVFSLPVATATSAETLALLRGQGLAILATRVADAEPYYRVDFRPPTAIVLGSEAAGLGREWQAADIRAIALPMLGIADSLNVSAAAAVLFYEALRQRGMELGVAAQRSSTSM